MIGSSLIQAVAALRQGEVIAVPTEAVYGLSCDPDNITAVEKLLALKQRESSKGLILVSDTLDKLLPYLAPITEQQRATVLNTWPGPVTWVIPKASTLPRWLSGEHNSIAVRVTAHPLLRELCHQFQKPIVSTSANRSTQSPAKTAEQVFSIFKNEPLHFILEGALGQETKPTQIRDLLTNKILRD